MLKTESAAAEEQRAAAKAQVERMRKVAEQVC